MQTLEAALLYFLGNQIAAKIVFCFVESVRNCFILNFSEL